MRLTQLFAGEKQIENKGIQPGNSGSAISRQIRALIPGQTIRGEVAARSGSEVQLKLAGDMLLNARVDKNILLEIGKNVIFEVKNNGSSLTLSPLFENMAADENVLKALDMASLPINESTVAMTEKLMQGGMPIDRNTLIQVYREMNAFLQAEITDLVDLHRLGIPVDESSVNQIASYKNLTYQLGEGIGQLAEALPQTLGEMVREGNLAGAAKLWNEFLSLLHWDSSEGGSNAVSEEAALTGNTNTGETVLSDMHKAAESPILEELKRPEDSGMREASQTIQETSHGIQEASRGTQYMYQNVSHEGNHTIDLVSQLFSKIAQGGTAQERALKSLSRLLSGDSLREALRAGSRKEFGITPQEVADAKRVQEFYEKLEGRLSTFRKALEEAGQTGSQVFKAAGNLSQNLDFMQQINHAYTYVQLPLRFQQGSAHGDLYVFTNKKNLAASEGKISALLHLDMEHLGPVDVYVAMEYERVSTKFYVPNDEMLDFLEGHMELLTKRLKARGYDCSLSLEVREDAQEPGGITRILQTAGNVPLSQYAFDMRA